MNGNRVGVRVVACLGGADRAIAHLPEPSCFFLTEGAPFQWQGVRARPASVLLLGALVATTMSATVIAQATNGWIQVGGGHERYQHAMAYDSQRGRTVMFGGSSYTILQARTHEWNGVMWATVSTTGPSARVGHAMAYDSQRNRTVLFGGSSASGPQGDTWEWNGTNWQPQIWATGPAAQGDHAMAYDSQRGRTVLFGRGETWAWDGTTWLQVASVGPSSRTGHAMAYDSHRGQTVLWGGSAGADTWEWDGITWTQRATSAGGPSWVLASSPAMVYDSQRRRTVLFAESFLSAGATWDWDGVTWTQVPVSGPSGRTGHAMVYDSQRNRTVLVGGSMNGGLFQSLADTWELGFPGTATTYATGCGSPALVLSPVASARPITGATAQAVMSRIPSSLAFVAIGWSNTNVGAFPLPLPLVSYGMPGCDLLQSAEFAFVPVVSSGSGSATYSLAVPNQPGLLGLHLYLQGWANALGQNAANVIVSNGVEWAIGNS
ncbi:MAG: hypothetical protein KDC98_14970 [Planctomycetes bacterium]|nr:hypothetical protein [Planctomycetota bacterium]